MKEAQATAKALQEKTEQQYRVYDPDNKTVDRTPQNLAKKAHGAKPRKRVAATSGGPGESSLSQQPSASETSVSQLGSSTRGSEDELSSSNLEGSEAIDVDKSSDSQSTDRQSAALRHHKSNLSSDAMTDYSTAHKSSEHGKIRHGFDEAEIRPPHHEGEYKPKEWTAEERRSWLYRDVTITLVETPTIMLYSRADEVIPKENGDEVQAITKRNERYAKFCEARKGGESGGRYQTRGMTTLNDHVQNLGCWVQPPPKRNIPPVQATSWKLYDEMMKQQEEAEAEGGVTGGMAGEAEEAATAAAEEEGAQGEEEVVASDDEAEAGEEGTKTAASSAKRGSAWMNSASLLENVLIVERAVVSNMFEELQLAYRGIPMEKLTDVVVQSPQAQSPNAGDTTSGEKRRRFPGGVTDQEEKGEQEKGDKEPAPPPSTTKSKLRILWKYGTELTKGKNTSCMSWNRHNPDILATGYGEYGIPGAGAGATTISATGSVYPGFVCCWSLKNPLAPERVIQVESEAGVSSVHFSKQHPSLLAVGNTDGTLALYDVRKHGNTPALKTTVGTGQHTGTIWEVSWVERGKDRGENLISISADGHVMEWSIKKGLERTADLMKLKRAPNKNTDQGYVYMAKGAIREALLSRQSGGMCFDINPKEPITYIVGTEDGTVHKCSKTQNENTVRDYTPHAEPVYRCRWSPFHADYFLTCSADWTSRLYHTDLNDPVARFDSNKQDAVHDVCWSPVNATIFSAATAQGCIDVWDIADPNQPRTSLQLEDRVLNCLLFGYQDSPILTVGDNRGEVTVVKVTGSEFERSGATDREQEERFEQVVEKIST